MDNHSVDENDIQDFDEFEEYCGIINITDTDEPEELDFDKDLTVNDYSYDEEIDL